VTEKLKIGILASGAASNLPSILQAVQSGSLNAEVVLLISNRPNAEAIQVAQRFNIATMALKPDLFNSKEDYDARLATEFWNKKADLIVLCGYTRVLSLPILKAYEKRIVNIHPSLLPAFGGKGMYGNKVHEAVLNRGVKLTGCTVHVVDDNIDEGPILQQASVELGDFETIETIKAKVRQLEEQIYPEAITKFAKSLTTLNFNDLPYALKEAGAQTSAPSPDFFDDARKEFAYTFQDKKAYAICDVGLKRKENADTVILTSDLKIIGVADGIGSAKEGKQTSRMIMSFIEKKWLNEGTQMRLKSLDHGSWLRKTVIEANQQILTWAHQSVNRVDIGSTLVIGIIDYENHDIYISNTGDSRVYLWRSGIMYRLTRDHSENFNAESGEGGALLFYMGGTQGSFGIDLFQLRLYKGDRLLFCSDGLLYATEEQVARRLQENLPVKELGNELLKDAYGAGAPDNTSIAVLEY
jgi:phosphoribosylglycinamide formyltransferase-1